MVTTSVRIAAPTTRDWPTLRELVVRGSTTHQCREIAAAVADAPHAAMAWRQRLADLSGRDRTVLFAYDAHGRAYALLAAYVDGERAERHVVVRHLLVLPTPAKDPETTSDLLDRVEVWAAEHHAAEVLLEVEDPGVEAVLASRGYRPTGARRPALDADALPGDGWATEWHRLLRTPHSLTNSAIFAVAS